MKKDKLLEKLQKLEKDIEEIKKEIYEIKSFQKIPLILDECPAGGNHEYSNQMTTAGFMCKKCGKFKNPLSSGERWIV